jgi:hypothetical protein
LEEFANFHLRTFEKRENKILSKRKKLQTFPRKHSEKEREKRMKVFSGLFIALVGERERREICRGGALTLTARRKYFTRNEINKGGGIHSFGSF